MKLSNVIIVLSRPEEPGNIGAVCRAMKNMGLSQLRLVEYAGGGQDDAVIRARAVHAADIWDAATTYRDLETAIADCPLVIGTTRRTGRRRKAASLSPSEAAAWIAEHPGPGALVFGNERTGLEDRELKLCNLASCIPSNAEFPSLNLSHAVQVYAYEIYKTLRFPENELPGVRRWIPMPQAELAPLVESITNSLESLGFYKQPGREEQAQFFQDMLSRAGVSRWEGNYLAGIFAKAARLARKGT